MENMTHSGISILRYAIAPPIKIPE